MKTKPFTPHDGINDHFRNTLKSDGEVPQGSAKNKPEDHPWQGGFKGKGERFKAWKNGKSKTTKKLSKGSQFYYTRDRNPDGSQRLRIDNDG